METVEKGEREIPQERVRTVKRLGPTLEEWVQQETTENGYTTIILDRILRRQNRSGGMAVAAAVARPKQWVELTRLHIALWASMPDQEELELQGCLQVTPRHLVLAVAAVTVVAAVVAQAGCTHMAKRS